MLAEVLSEDVEVIPLLPPSILSVVTAPAGLVKMQPKDG